MSEPVKAGAPRAARDTDEDRWKRTLSNIRTIGGAVALALLIRIGLIEMFQIEGPSMQPTLLHNERVVVAKFPYGLFLPWMTEAVVTWGMPSPGDVIILCSPADNVDIVKRVVGVPGDTIEVRDRVVYRNGAPIFRRRVGECLADQQIGEDPGCVVVEEGIGDNTWTVSYSQDTLNYDDEPLVTVPPGHVFVLGDHRDSSNDSRRIGPIPFDRVKGRALTIYWSWSSLAGSLRWDRMFSGVD